jgi:hypothetical protein
MRKIKTGILLILFSLLSGACSDQGDEAKIIPPEKMKMVLWDYLQIQHYTHEILGRDSAVNDTFAFIKLRDSMFIKHQTDALSFEKTLVYYRNHPDEFIPLLDSVAAYEKRIKKPDRSPNRMELDVFLDSLDLR